MYKFVLLVYKLEMLIITFVSAAGDGDADADGTDANEFFQLKLTTLVFLSHKVVLVVRYVE